MIRSGQTALRAVAGIGLAVAALVSSGSASAPADPFVDTVLRREGFSAPDFRARDDGEAVVKSLETPVRREIAHFGVSTSTLRPTALSINSQTSSGSSGDRAFRRSAASAILRGWKIWRR